MNRSLEINELATALAAAQGEFQAVPKTASNLFFKSSYANLPSVVLAASPILSKHGLSVTQLPDFDGENDLLTTSVMHSSGQWIEASQRLHLVKSDPQGQGSAITYGRRYAYSGGIGIVTDEDDDGNAASKSSNKPSTTTHRPAPVAAAPKVEEDPQRPFTDDESPAGDTEPGSAVVPPLGDSPQVSDVTQKDVNKVRALLRKVNPPVTEPVAILMHCSNLIRPVENLKELTREEMDRLVLILTPDEGN